MKYSTRRWRNTVFLALACVLMLTALSIIDQSLNIQQYYSGWLMIIIVSLLMLFYVRKRLSVLPIGRSSSWAQWHYYSGLFLLIVFLKHIEFRFPNGMLEISLTIVFAVVIVTGIVGGITNRVFARRLSYLEAEVIYERIPAHREQLKGQVEQLLLNVVAQSESNTLSKYYLAHLQRFFNRSEHFLQHVFNNDYPVLKIQRDLEQQLRYLNEYEVNAVMELRKLIAQKNMLDRHAALQGVLKYWGILHMPVATVLLFFIIAHVVLVYAFSGAA